MLFGPGSAFGLLVFLETAGARTGGAWRLVGNRLGVLHAVFGEQVRAVPRRCYSLAHFRCRCLRRRRNGRQIHFHAPPHTSRAVGVELNRSNNPGQRGNTAVNVQRDQRDGRILTKRNSAAFRIDVTNNKKGAAGGRAKAAIRKGQGANAQIERAQTFVKDTAKKAGTGRSSVQRDVTRGKKVKVLRDIVGTSLDKGAEIDALAKLPASEQESLAKAAKRGEEVSAITRRASDCNAEDPKMSEGTEEIELGKVIARLRRQQSRNKDTMFICDALERALQRGDFRSTRARSDRSPPSR
jgi:hypothetical protein